VYSVHFILFALTYSMSEPPSKRQKVKPEEEAPVNLDDWFVPKTLPFKRKAYALDGKRKWKKLKQILQAEGYENLPASEATYANIEAPPSMYPPKKFCDVTGFEAPYTDPKTRMRYSSADLFPVIRSLPYEVVQQYLAIRNAQVVLK
jgi:INO80 complex subunit C